MAENKRFERVYGDVEVVCIDHYKNGEDKFFDDDYDKFVELLNVLHEENQNLRKCINEIYLISSRESVE